MGAKQAALVMLLVLLLLVLGGRLCACVFATAPIKACGWCRSETTVTGAVYARHSHAVTVDCFCMDGSMRDPSTKPYQDRGQGQFTTVKP